jgi:general secretion pathway protein G
MGRHNRRPFGEISSNEKRFSSNEKSFLSNEKKFSSNEIFPEDASGTRNDVMMTYKYTFSRREGANAPAFRPPSLVEILALVLPVLAAVALGYTLVSGLPKGEDAHYARARDDIRAIRSLMLLETGLPATEPGLQWLVDTGRLPFLPLDPWGRSYQYRNPGKEYAYELFSLGPDGVESQDDVIAWNLYGGR